MLGALWEQRLWDGGDGSGYRQHGRGRRDELSQQKNEAATGAGVCWGTEGA